MSVETDYIELPTEQQKIFSDRKRTNIFRNTEQRLILNLLPIVPKAFSPNTMTFIGLLGSILVFTGFLLAVYLGKWYLLIGIPGLAINWLGDSLDGRLAYYRNIPRKWYGFALDIIMDWFSIALTGLGYFLYAEGSARFLAFLFVVFYGWSMLVALLRYKITNRYSIDSGLVGPTELRIIISLILIAEVVFTGSILYLAGLITFTLLLINITDTRKLLKSGDLRDDAERNQH